MGRADAYSAPAKRTPIQRASVVGSDARTASHAQVKAATQRPKECPALIPQFRECGAKLLDAPLDAVESETHRTASHPTLTV